MILLLTIAAIASLFGLVLTAWAIAQDGGQFRLFGDGRATVSASAEGRANDPDDVIPPRADELYRVWDRNADGRPIRWNPCQPIEFAVNRDGGPDEWVDLFQEALGRVAAASGLTLVLHGETEERPSVDRPALNADRYGRRWSPVLVAWAAPDESGLPMSETDRGVALPLAAGTDGQRTLVSGQVVFNSQRNDPEHAWPGLRELQLNFDDRATSWGATMIHELLHLVGLNHVDDPDQLMYTYAGTGPVEFGLGDRAGLDELHQGCVDVPDPAEVDTLKLVPNS